MFFSIILIETYPGGVYTLHYLNNRKNKQGLVSMPLHGMGVPDRTGSLYN